MTLISCYIITIDPDNRDFDYMQLLSYPLITLFLKSTKASIDTVIDSLDTTADNCNMSKWDTLIIQ